MSTPEAHLSPHAARKPGIAMSAGTTPKLTMLDLLREQCSRDASDLLLTAGAPPQLRVNGALIGVGDQPLDAESVRRLAASVLNEAQQRELQTRMDFDFSLGIEGLSRFRIHIYQQRGSMAVAVRMIPHRVPAFESLGIPAIARDFASRPNGLVLVTGPTGSGKSTTLAAMIDLINHARHAHIVCIEDPIEYLHHHELSIVEQREVARDTHGFADALRAVFRETPDVIMVGEMRDLETISLALTLAETGHLILATLHTQDTSHAITRIVDAFPADQQAQVAMQLSLVLIGVLAQQLIPSADGRRRVLATEVMHVNSAIRNLIRGSHPRGDRAPLRHLGQHRAPAPEHRRRRYPRLTGEEIVRALAIEAEETLQMPREALYMDWHVNAAAAAGDPLSATDGVLVTAPKAEIERHLDALSRTGIQPAVVDAGCLAVCNLYLAIKGPVPAEHAVGLVALSNRRADIAVLSHENGIFPRTVFTPVAAWDESAGYLAECVADTIKFHQFKLHGPPVERLYLTGTVPRRDVLVRHLRELAPLMAFWNPVSDMTVESPRLQPLRDSESGAILSTCLGLALRSD